MSMLWLIDVAIRYAIAFGLFSLFPRALKRMKKDISLLQYILLCLIVGPLMLILLILLCGLGPSGGRTENSPLYIIVAILVSGWEILEAKRIAKRPPYESPFSECRECGYTGAFKNRCPKCKSTDVSDIECRERDVTKLIPDDFELKYHTILTKWLLWLETILCFMLAMQYLAGAHYYATEDYNIMLRMAVRQTPELVYEFYGLPLRMLDIFMVLAFCALAVFVIITRRKLERFDKNALKYLYGIIVAGGALRILHSVALIAMTSLNKGGNQAFIFKTELVGVLGAVVAFLMLKRSRRYYDARKILFENGPFEKDSA